MQFGTLVRTWNWKGMLPPEGKRDILCVSLVDPEARSLATQGQQLGVTDEGLCPLSLQIYLVDIENKSFL